MHNSRVYFSYPGEYKYQDRGPGLPGAAATIIHLFFLTCLMIFRFLGKTVLNHISRFQDFIDAFRLLHEITDQSLKSFESKS